MVKVQSDVGTYAQLPRWVDLLHILSLYGKSGVSNNPSAIIYTTYTNLVKVYTNPQTCKAQLENQFRTKWTEKINNAVTNDPDCRLGVYSRINPELVSWVPIPQKVHELERKIVTRFRTGSHSLNVELGRFSNIPRENRLCKCGTGVQTVWHIFDECPITHGMIQTNFSDLNELFSNENIHLYLLQLTKSLKIPIGRLWNSDFDFDDA